jgi:MYXO-CTERM domain-containing protein
MMGALMTGIVWMELMMMKHVWISIVVAGLLVAADVGAVDLRRPYEAAHAVSYGYDNDGGASGCTDYACGSICYNGHGGNDFPLSLGTNVLAAADGTVVATNNGCADYGSYGNTCGGRCGNYVKLRHSDGDTTIYCHMKLNSLTVSTGQDVSCGQVIGKSASSGSSTGPHLHLGWNPGDGAATDVYAGSCTSSPGAWRNQRGYGEPPGAECGCVPSDEVCDGTDNDCDGTVDNGDVCEIELLHEAPNAYAPAKTTDVDGNGSQDVCARFYSGFRCFGPAGSGWEQVSDSDLMPEENGWGAPKYYATVRMGDVDGDGLADVCARHSGGFSCWRSTGDGFEAFDTIDNWTNDNSWDNPQYYTTMRLTDINGDDLDDVCARGASGWRCYLSTPAGFGDRVEGPDWSDAGGFDKARYYGTIRTGDIDGDGLEDVCMRQPDGFVCYRSTGDGFEHLTTNDTMTDANGWGNIIYWPSIRLADVNGDGMLDLCARNSRALFCRLFDGADFGERIELGGLSNDSGWSDPTNYATLRAGDVTGDGSDELCIRANAGMLCYRVDGDDVSRFDGPEWSNANGWDAPAAHGPTFITSLDDTEPGALCGRSPDGLTCQNYADGAFQAYPRFDEFTDDGGWTARKFYSTIRMGLGVCRAGRCEEPVDDDEPVDEAEPVDAGSVDTGGDAGIGSDAAGQLADVGTSGDIGASGDLGLLGDGGESSGSGMKRVTSSGSCAAAPSERPGAPVWLAVASVLGLLWWRRRRPAARLAAAALAVFAVGLVGCDRSAADADQAPTSQEPETSTYESTATAPAAAGPFDEHELLAVHGSWRVLGERVDLPEGTDGALRYQPVLLHGDETVEWPLDMDLISEVRLVGDGPALFALGLDSTLVGVSLGDGERLAEPAIIDDEVSSQLTAAPDGCCIAYIRQGGARQALQVRGVDGALMDTVELGYSLGWAPALSERGERAAWTASPHGVASILVAETSGAEPRAIVNGEEGRTADDLEPFPNGPHAPVWTPDGIAFQADRLVWLIDADGRFVGMADADGGMFWDEARGELVDRDGAAIRWQEPESDGP